MRHLQPPVEAPQALRWLAREREPQEQAQAHRLRRTILQVASSESSPQGDARPPITGNTQGVIGMSDLKLESGSQNSQQGSLLTSEKNNVKIEKGTMMLLRVNQ